MTVTVSVYSFRKTYFRKLGKKYGLSAGEDLFAILCHITADLRHIVQTDLNDDQRNIDVLLLTETKNTVKILGGMMNLVVYTHVFVTVLKVTLFCMSLA